MRTPVDIGKYRDEQSSRIDEPETALSDLESLLSRIQQILARHAAVTIFADPCCPIFSECLSPLTTNSEPAAFESLGSASSPGRVGYDRFP